MTRAPRSFSSSRRLQVAVVTCIGLAAVAAGPVAPGAQAATRATITADYFGTHHAGLGQAGPRGWPQTSAIGSVRLWDNGTAWNQIETSPGQFNWSRVDALVKQARTKRAKILLVLGQTPSFHASKPSAPGVYGAGATSMPTAAAWKAYVTAAAKRNQSTWGNSVEFQVWNEANVASYWSGTPKQMAALTVWTRQALTAARSKARLVAPALVTRLSTQQSWIRSFYAQKPGGKNVSTYADALSFQLYPLKTGKPEDSMKLLAKVKAVLRKNKVSKSKPIYNTEVNYGLVGGTQAGAPAKPIAVKAQQANVARTYLLNAQNGVRRVYWYSWDLQRMSNTPLVGSNGSSLAAGGRAFGVVRSWIYKTRPAGCTVRKGIYTCTFTVGKTVKRAVWKTSGSAKVVVPRKTSSYITIDGKKHRTKAGKRVTAGAVPVLLVGRR